MNAWSQALRALIRAIGQLPHREMRTPLLHTALWTLAAFGAVWLGLVWLLHLVLNGNGWLQTVLSVLGNLGAPLLALLLVPMLATTIAGFYTEAVVRGIERIDYPDLPPLPVTRYRDQIRSMIGLTALSIGTNLVLLPLYLLLPGANLVLFLGLNGYLLARGNYELVALRRLDWAETRRVWARHRLAFVLVGTALAATFAVPIVNLLTPMIGAAATVHLLEGIRRPPENRSTGSIKRI